MRDALESHLRLPIREQRVKLWHEGQIRAGDEREKVLGAQLEQADVIVLLLSKFFFASCIAAEQQAFERHRQGTARVIPVLVQPTSLQLSWLKDLQALPRDGRPVSAWSNEDDAWVHVVENLLQVGTPIAHRPALSLVASDRTVKLELTLARHPIRSEDPALIDELTSVLGAPVIGLRIIEPVPVNAPDELTTEHESARSDVYEGAGGGTPDEGRAREAARMDEGEQR